MSDPHFLYHVFPGDEFEGKRLDWSVAQLLAPISRSKISRAIKEGAVQVDGSLTQGKSILRSAQVVEVDLSFFEIPPLEAEPFTFPVLFEDDFLMIINKPAGWITHPAPGVRTGTVVNALLGSGRSLSSGSAPERPGIVHRLDAQTTGALIVAKTDEVQSRLQMNFQEHRIHKRYLAIVDGQWETRPEGFPIDLPLGRDPHHPERQSVLPGGREAHSLFLTRAIGKDTTLMEVRIFTGRTHQIRVHASAFHHPVLGDLIYGPKKQRYHPAHHLLHAVELEFLHPVTGAPLLIRAPWDAEFQKALDLQGISFDLNHL